MAPEDDTTDDTSDVPTLLHANAWCGDGDASGGCSEHAAAWATTGMRPLQRLLAVVAAPGLDLADWRNSRVGWGVVLPDRDGLSDADKAAGVDAPPAIRRLLAARAPAPVFRYREDIGRDGRLLRHYPNRPATALHATGTRGVADLAVPRYLLIVGSPKDIPWRFQYRLQVDAFVGRLDLDDDALERYVDALLAGWPGSPRRVEQPLLWSVDHGHPDITHLMRKTIAEKMQEAFAQQAGFDSRLLTDDLATAAQLRDTLQARTPAFVLSTSHGATFPLGDPAMLHAQLGLLVDRDHTLVDPAALLQQWQPAGAIWYAHACCSAGADAPSTFQGLVDRDSSLGRMLGAVAGIGPCTAPLPRALLGATQPLGAFIGHVEPTFDWTLRDPDNGQRMTDSLIVDTLFTALHSAPRTPVGMALDHYYDAVAGLLLDHIAAVEAVNNHEDNAQARAVKAKLQAMDRLAMVLLGDPTVCLP